MYIKVYVHNTYREQLRTFSKYLVSIPCWIFIILRPIKLILEPTDNLGGYEPRHKEEYKQNKGYKTRQNSRKYFWVERL